MMVKLGVVLFVIGLGSFYINPANWTSMPVNERLLPEEVLIPDMASNYATDVEKLPKEEAKARALQLATQTLALFKIDEARQDGVRMVKEGDITQEEADARSRAAYETHCRTCRPPTARMSRPRPNCWPQLHEQAPAKAAEKWGMLGLLGLNHYLVPIDDATRSSFIPYGISGLMLGASLVFFAFIGFDAVSTQAEEARNPQRDMPIAIMASLVLCTVLYIAVSAVITGMVPYPHIDQHAADRQRLRRPGREGKQHRIATRHGLDRRRRPGRHDKRAAGDVSQPGARLHGHVSRRIAAADFWPRASQVPHAPPGYDVNRGRDLRRRGIHADQRPDEDGQHRHAFGLYRCLRGGAAVAHPAARRPRPFRCPVIYVVAPLGHPRQPDDDAVSSGEHLAEAGRVAGDRTGDLRLL